jgi:hypothetical protein
MAELYRFTDGIQSIGFSPGLFSENWNGTNFIATAISRSALSITGNLVKNQVTFTFPSTNEFARRRVFDMPGEKWGVEIYEDKTLLWTGRVIMASLAGTKITITTDSTERRDARNPTGARFALHCWKTLYSETCGAIKNNFKTTLTAIPNGTSVEISIPQELNRYAGGIIEKNGESRKIVRNFGTTLIISSPFSNNSTGSADIFPGCNLTSIHCLGFNNILNFGGFEYIPLTNPTERSGLL